MKFRARRIVHGFTIILAPVLLSLFLNPLNLGIAYLLHHTGGLDSLQQWALALIDRPIEELIEPHDYKAGTRYYPIKSALWNNQIRLIDSCPTILKDKKDNTISERGLFIQVHLNTHPFLLGWGLQFTHPGEPIPDACHGKVVKDGILRYYLGR